MTIRRSGLLILVWFLVGIRVVIAQSPSSLVSVKLDKNNVHVTAGAEFTVVLTATIPAGWHINSSKPSEESLIPTRIDAKGKSIILVSVGYPEAEDIKLGISDSPLSVFEGNCRFTLTLKIGDALHSGREATAVILYYQACNDQICMPPTSVRATLLVDIEPNAKRKPFYPGRPKSHLPKATSPGESHSGNITSGRSTNEW